MPTTRETVLTALHARLQTLAATVLRDEVLPERIPPAGLIRFRRFRRSGTGKFRGVGHDSHMDGLADGLGLTPDDAALCPSLRGGRGRRCFSDR